MFSAEKISFHGGLELLRRFLVAIDFRGRIRATFRDAPLDGDDGAVRMLMLLMGLLVIGGLRVTHLAFVGTDPIGLRFAGLPLTPADRTVVAWLKAFDSPMLEKLSELILAQLGQILRVWNRPGNVHDSHNAAGFLRGVFGDLRGRFGHRLPVELRMDAAFFHPEIFSFLDGERVEYALKVPM